MFASVKTKILGIAIFPLIIALGFMFTSIADKYFLAQEMEQHDALAHFVVNMGGMLHELQKERGASGVFLGSKGTRFRDELTALRETTDAQLTKLQAFLAEFIATEYGTEVEATLKVAKDKLATLPKLRSGISELSISPKESLATYSAINAALLNSVASVANYGNNSQMSKNRTAFLNFIQGKEQAGIERAILAGVFTQNRFNTGVYSRFTSLITKQDTYFDVFNLLASPKQQGYYNDYINNSAIAATQKLRDIAITKGVPTSKAELLAELNRLLGYGGAIHLFKNYLLRQQDKYIAPFEFTNNRILAILDKLVVLPYTTDEDKKHIDTVKETLKQYGEAMEKAKRMVESGYSPEEIDGAIKIEDAPALSAITALIKSSVPGNFGIDPAHWFKTITKKINLMREVENYTAEDLKALSAELKMNAHNGLISLIVMALVVTVVVLFTVIFVATRISAPLKSAVVVAEKISGGDLTGHIECNTKDEIGTLSTALNNMTQNLKDMMRDVEATTQELTHAATEMATISGQTSRGVSQQQSEVQQVSTAMNEMSHTVSQVSDNAANAQKATHEATSEASLWLVEGVHISGGSFLSVAMLG